ncbi:hypothetical protein SNEBB_007704, partial [Seison nebaliae]
WENTGFAIYDSTDQWGFTTLKSEIITRRPKYVLDLTSSESELDYEPNIEVTPSAKVISMDKSTFPNSKLNSLKKLDTQLTSGQMLTSNGSDNDDTVKHFDQKNENKSVVTSSVRTEENKFTKKSAIDQ